MAGWGVPCNGLDQQPRPRGSAKAAGGRGLLTSPLNPGGAAGSPQPSSGRRRSQREPIAAAGPMSPQTGWTVTCSSTPQATLRPHSDAAPEPGAVPPSSSDVHQQDTRGQKRPPSRAPLCPFHGDEGTEGRTVTDTPSPQLRSETTPGRLPVFTPPHQFTEGKCGALKHPASRLLTELACFLKTLSRISVF